MTDFDRALKFLLSDRIEGGFVDDPNDLGGPTNRGVSLRAIRQLDADGFAGLDFDLDLDGDVDVDDVRLITVEKATEFYEVHYWQAARCPELPWPVSLVVFDCAVNQGVGTSARVLQRAVGVDVDGVIGPKTLAALLTKGSGDVVREMIVGRLDMYRQIPTAAQFFRGWAGRMLDLLLEAAL